MSSLTDFIIGLCSRFLDLGCRQLRVAQIVNLVLLLSLSFLIVIRIFLEEVEIVGWVAPSFTEYGFDTLQDRFIVSRDINAVI